VSAMRRTYLDTGVLIEAAAAKSTRALGLLKDPNGPQGVHSDLRHGAREDAAVLPAIEPQDRTVAQITQRGVHPARNAGRLAVVSDLGGADSAMGRGKIRLLDKTSL